MSEQNNTPESFDFESFLAGLDEPTRNGLTGHFEGSTAGLKSALDAERKRASAFEKSVRELTGKAEKGSEMEQRLGQLSSEMDDLRRQNQFLEAASSAKVADAAAAWVLLKAGNLFKSDGSPDLDALKAKHPLVFATEKKAEGGTGAGNGAGTGQPPASDMNAFIRQSTGR